MKVIIAGSRSIKDDDFVADAIAESGFVITEVVSGGAVGVDRSGEYWAKRQGISMRQFIPDWDKYGKGAGFVRNIAMAEYADALIACRSHGSRGTTHMIETAKSKGLKVFVVEYKS